MCERTVFAIGVMSDSVFSKELKIGELNNADSNRFDRIIRSYENLFVNEFKEFSITNAGACEIKTSNNNPIVSPPKHMSLDENDTLRAKIQELLRLGWIQKSNSEYSSNAFIKEINGKLELCVDYEKLNENTEAIPIPSEKLEDELMYIKKSNVFSKLVIKDAYRQIPMKSIDKRKTAFATSFGKFEFNVMPYGLKNNKQILEETMLTVLGDLSMKTTLNYGHILVPSQGLDAHFEVLEALFKALKKANLKVDAKMSSFCVDKVVFAGDVISRDGEFNNE